MTRTERNAWRRQQRLLARRGMETRHELAAAERNRERRAKQAEHEGSRKCNR